MLNVGVVGASGHTGEILIELLLKHPRVRISGLFSQTYKTRAVGEVFPQFSGRLDTVFCAPLAKEIASVCDLVFLALPHTISMNYVPFLLSRGKRVIDLSGDYRFKDYRVYEKFYGVSHKDISNIRKAVYGLPELYRFSIKRAKLVANPGCYPTAAILALAPLVACGIIREDTLVVDAKSGASGAGRKLVQELSFCEVNGDFKAYKVNTHQHIPEINQVLSRLSEHTVDVTFVPHLLPVERGILETVYCFKKPVSGRRRGIPGTVRRLFANFYETEPFIRLKEEGSFPRLKDVRGTNFCDIGIKEEEDRIIVISAIDNLVKGAAGQAVQNMNIMCGFPEKEGLL
ncbi:MAG: N-acetyl-gamma-glutamyl-phosphate reductase [Candidatus Omnitrophota bacterium]|jgi:N-acetyl-gamma-glutamyl-phosphate reductase